MLYHDEDYHPADDDPRDTCAAPRCRTIVTYGESFCEDHRADWRRCDDCAEPAQRFGHCGDDADACACCGSVRVCGCEPYEVAGKLRCRVHLVCALTHGEVQP